MTQKTALILSAVLTAFVLVVGGGVIARVSQPEPAPAATPIVAPADTAPIADVTAQVQELVQQREAQYRQLIDQANQRLQAMNQQLAAAPVAQAAPAPAAPAPARSTTPQFAVSAEQATNIAVGAANGSTMIRQAELVRFEGKVAYEVGFTRGAIYIDANTGAVLFNSTQRGGGQPAVSSPTHESEHEDEHEDEHEHEEEHESEHDDDHD
jgi:uncharacterized membrane protein YkoI